MTNFTSANALRRLVRLQGRGRRLRTRHVGLVTCACLALAASAGTANAAMKTLTASSASNAAEDAILDRLGNDGTLDQLRCTRANPRRYTCRAAGTMWGTSSGEHAFTATATVSLTCTSRTKCRKRVRLQVRHADGPAPGSDGTHRH